MSTSNSALSSTEAPLLDETSREQIEAIIREEVFVEGEEGPEPRALAYISDAVDRIAQLVEATYKARHPVVNVSTVRLNASEAIVELVEAAYKARQTADADVWRRRYNRLHDRVYSVGGEYTHEHEIEELQARAECVGDLREAVGYLAYSINRLMNADDHHIDKQKLQGICDAFYVETP